MDGWIFALYAGVGIFVLILSMMALTLLLCRKMTKSSSASTNTVIADSTPTDAVCKDVAVEGEKRDIPVNTFKHAPAFNTQNDNIHIFDVYANDSWPENAMDPVCSKLDLAEDPGVHVTKDNPIYSSAKEDYETTEHTKYSTDVYYVLMKPKQKM